MGQGVHRHLGLGARRDSVVDILQTQLKRGTKPVKKSPGKFVPMNDGDIKRINRDLTILAGPIRKYKKKNRKYSKDLTKI